MTKPQIIRTNRPLTSIIITAAKLQEIPLLRPQWIDAHADILERNQHRPGNNLNRY